MLHVPGADADANAGDRSYLVLAKTNLNMNDIPRLMKRRGIGPSQVAVAHSMLVSAYWMLKRDEPYHDLGADWHRRRNDQAHTRRLVPQLERLGHTVIIDPPA